VLFLQKAASPMQQVRHSVPIQSMTRGLRKPGARRIS